MATIKKDILWGVTQLASPIKTETIIFKIDFTRLRVPTGWRQTSEPLKIVAKELNSGVLGTPSGAS